MLLYYITDRTQFSGDERNRRKQLLQKIAEAARAGVDFIQLREKDLASRELEQLAREAMQHIQAAEIKTRLLINSRADIALAVGADGVHLRSQDISPQDVRKIWHDAKVTKEPVVGVSCHGESDVVAAKEHGADFVVFGPVFEKSGSLGAGLDGLRSACRLGIPVLALGGVTPANARLCIAAGAAGIAGIRLFQENEIKAVVEGVDR